MNLIKRIEDYISGYVTLADQAYSLPLALWIIGTFCYTEFDAYPYLVITSATKRSGKTRLSEMISFCCSNPRNFAAMTAATMFRSIEDEKPCLIFDEAEGLSSEAASTMRSVLNVGYRRGQTVPRTVAGGIKEFPTYCPKMFVLIGDVYDTLRDRSIIVIMRRAETRRRFVFETAREEGRELREAIHDAVTNRIGGIQKAFMDHKGLPFLMDRDEEIWTSLFCIAEVFCKDRLQELQACAVDMATEKTSDGRRYIDLRDAEDAAMDDEYARRLIADLYALLATNGDKISSKDAIEGLKGIVTAPWRKFRGTGLDESDMAKMLSRFGVRPTTVRLGRGRKNSTVKKGYRRADVERGLQKV